MLKQAVILAGGLGTRLGELTRDCPKPLIQIAGRPFLEYILWNLRRYGIEEVVLSVGYLADTIQEVIGDGARFGVSVVYAVEKEPAGTGGALKVAEPLLQDSFLLINGDTIFDVNYLDLELTRRCAQSLVTMALRRVEDVSRYGSVEILDGKVFSFKEKGSSGSGYVNGGVYAVDKRIVSFIDSCPCSLEKDVLPFLALKGMVAGKAYDNFFIDIGVPHDLAAAQHLVPIWRKKPAVFFDRDGVLNFDKGYVHRSEDFGWTPGAVEAVKLVNDLGFLAIVVTNQAGIARGYYSEQDFLRFSTWINEELKKRGAHIDATYYCPHHPTEGLGKYRTECYCRKPKPGLLLRAISEWDIDTSRSVFLGDKESDIEAARAAGIEGLRVREGEVYRRLKLWLEEVG